MLTGSNRLIFTNTFLMFHVYELSASGPCLIFISFEGVLTDHETEKKPLIFF